MTAQSDSVWARLKERWVLVLFGLPFAGVGIGFLIIGVLGSLNEWREMQSWQPVMAQLIDVKLDSSTSDGSTTYRVSAKYNYEVAGRRYTGSRVGISTTYDNIGDYHQVEASRLRRAMQQGLGVQAWVNPDNPQQAVLNRELRWGMLGFKMIFVLAFGGVGLGIIAYCFLAKSDLMPGQRSAEELASKPWLERRDWASPEVKSDGKTTLYAAWGITAFWNVIAIPAGIGGVSEALKGEWLALLALLFPLVGVGFLWWAISATQNWRRFGPAPLQLDPYPGAVGGQVGGHIDVNLPYSINNRFDVTLKCLRSYVSGSGKNRTRRESLVWQSEGVAHTQASMKGTQLDILFDVEAGLPVSEIPDNNYHLWRLDVKCELPGTDFSRSYVIPVFATGERAVGVRELSTENTLAQESREQALDTVLNVRQIAGGVILHYPAWRHPAGKLVLVAIGAVFATIGFMVPADDFPSWIFSLIGMLMALAGIYTLTTSLDVRIDQAELITRRRILGVSFGNKRYPRSSVRSLALKESYSAQSGSSHKTFYKIVANREDGKPVTIGFNLAGRNVAMQALESLSLLTGVPADGSKAV